ncbi:pseudouridine synthase, RluA family [Peptoniphilus sp. ING2-D1G]|nr:pseudouridine synthase, RluA family [Peptoniphilus sp. ING2-D1G]
MKELIIEKNDANQRLDRFLKKYLEKAPLSVIYKNIRKKNIKLNDRKATPESVLSEGDVIKLYLSDETIDKFLRDKVNFKSSKFPKVIYEDENILLMDKRAGVLSHNDSAEYVRNMVDMMIDYLIAKGEYDPRVEKTFRPALCNRLDRNTSGILIGAKNSESLRILNEQIRTGNIEKLYLTLVKGNTPENFEDESYLVKDFEKNKVFSTKKNTAGSKKSKTVFKKLKSSEDFSLLEVNLITGRTHQIRTVLKNRGFSVVGDVKYGNKNLNEKFLKKYNYKSQFLHNYKITFNIEKEKLSYLKGRSFYSELPELEKNILEDIFGSDFSWGGEG